MDQVISQWVLDALEADGLDILQGHEDSPAIRMTPSGKAECLMATAVSYDCCSQTQTKGPGCCQIEPDIEGVTPVVGRAAASRVWPLPAWSGGLGEIVKAVIIR